MEALYMIMRDNFYVILFLPEDDMKSQDVSLEHLVLDPYIYESGSTVM